MLLEIITWNDLERLFHEDIILFGTSKPASDLLNHIKANNFPINISFVTDTCPSSDSFMDYPCYPLSKVLEENKFDNKYILIANDGLVHDLNKCLDTNPKKIFLCSQALRRKIAPFEIKNESIEVITAKESFKIEGSCQKAKALVLNSFLTPSQAQKGDFDVVFEVADFYKQEFTTYTMPQFRVPIDLTEFSERVPTSSLPMRMSHLSYLLWKQSVHVVQMSYSRRYLVGAQYNFFHLNILDTHTGKMTKWHDLPPEDGLWDYVATGDFDDNEESFYFVRWPLEDAIKGMQDGSNKVHCQVGKLHLPTLTSTIIGEFDFQDRIHQCTISGDGRYMVFAPMRVLRPHGDPRKISQSDLMRNLQDNIILDSMATLDLKTGKSWFTQIPYPIPAHFELDPYDPHVFYVSTHSLMPYADGVLCFQPGTLQKMRIKENETIIEAEYTHPSFVRTTQHAVFARNNKVYIAATNQNKLEIIDAESMTLWHCHKFADDPLYDNTDFSDPEFLKKPFKLPIVPDYCNSISVSGDSKHLILKMSKTYKVFDLDKLCDAGEIPFRENNVSPSHSRYYMQNAPQESLNKQYSNLW